MILLISKKEYSNLPNKYKQYFESFKNNHCTVKSIKLFTYLTELFSKKGDFVLDPFMGSGTTGIACSILNREFIGIELEKDYFKIAEARIKEQNKQTNLFEEIK